MAETAMNGFELDRAIVSFYEANVGKYPNKQAVLIPVLMECQKRYGHITDQMAEAVSDLTRVAPSEVESVISFYTMLLEKPVGEYVIGLCCTWNCEHGGAGELVKHFEQKYGCRRGGIAADGLFTLLSVECLCDCHNAPSAQFLRFGDEFGAWWANNLTVEVFDRILDDLQAGKPDALRERLVRIDEKVNPPDDKKWVWIVTTNNQYPAWIEQAGVDYKVHDGFGKLADVRETNTQLYEEIKAALVKTG
jgi:NADH-quinone oxidoreductase subunit E